MPNANPPAIRFADVSRYFGDVRAVDRVNLEIQDGEFFTMLGPSGSGKTTCLRLIAGFDRPTAGQHLPAWEGCLQPAALRAGCQHGLSGLRPLPPHDRRR